jgi:copper oxidase (laccase) domain-containing protein
MKFTNILPDLKVKSLFLGKDEHLDEILNEEFAGYKVIRMIQIHSDDAVFLDESVVENFPDEVVFLDDVDGVFINHPKTVLVVKAADCYPILLHHLSGVIGVIHAGRAGMETEIVKKTLQSLVDERELKTDWNIWLGPRICKECYQINKETDVHYDVREKAIKQIQSVLNPMENFALDSNLCTIHDEGWFHSYRRDGEGVEMNYGLVGLA